MSEIRSKYGAVPISSFLEKPQDTRPSLADAVALTKYLRCCREGSVAGLLCLILGALRMAARFGELLMVDMVVAAAARGASGRADLTARLVVAAAAAAAARGPPVRADLTARVVVAASAAARGTSVGADQTARVVAAAAAAGSSAALDAGLTAAAARGASGGVMPTAGVTAAAAGGALAGAVPAAGGTTATVSGSEDGELLTIVVAAVDGGALAEEVREVFVLARSNTDSGEGGRGQQGSNKTPC